MKYKADIGMNWILYWTGAAGFVGMLVLLLFLAQGLERAEDDSYQGVDAYTKESGHLVQPDPPDGEMGVGQTNMRIRVGLHDYVYVYDS